MGLTAGLNSAKDLLMKLERDAKLLDEEVTSDRFFNFVVTGYSLIDWVKNDPVVPANAKTTAESLRRDTWLKICGDIATASKHFTLTRRKPVTASVESQQGYGLGRYGKGGYGEGEEDIKITLNDGSVFSALEFVNTVRQTWDQFFVAHGL
jgi:hypothetical protein